MESDEVGMESTRSVGWNHFEEMYGINPKEDTPAAIPYQSFGLDKKRTKFSIRSFYGTGLKT